MCSGSWVLERICCRTKLERTLEAPPKWREGSIEARLWAARRGQTLYRTVEGMMLYEKALRHVADFSQGLTGLVRIGSGTVTVGALTSGKTSSGRFEAWNEPRISSSPAASAPSAQRHSRSRSGAIAAATSNLSVTFDNKLLGYVTSAYLSTNYYTIVGTDGAIAAATSTLRAELEGDIDTVEARVVNVETARIGYCKIGGTATDHVTRETCEAAGGTWNVGLPIATAVKQVSVSDGDTTMALEQRFTAQKDTNGQLLGQYTVKIDADGYVAGFGLASTASDQIPEYGTGSEFAVRADKFWIASPGLELAPVVPLPMRRMAWSAKMPASRSAT